MNQRPFLPLCLRPPNVRKAWCGSVANSCPSSRVTAPFSGTFYGPGEKVESQGYLLMEEIRLYNQLRLVGLSHYLQAFLRSYVGYPIVCKVFCTFQGVCLGFLNHQQYHRNCDKGKKQVKHFVHRMKSIEYKYFCDFHPQPVLKPIFICEVLDVQTTNCEKSGITWRFTVYLILGASVLKGASKTLVRYMGQTLKVYERAFNHPKRIAYCWVYKSYGSDWISWMMLMLIISMHEYRNTR